VGSVLAELERRAQSHPDKLLFSFLNKDGIETVRHSYASFLSRVDLIASNLSSRSRLSSGERILLAFPPGLDLVCALFACARVGLIAVPVAPPTPHSFEAAVLRIAHVARDCKPAGLLTDIGCSNLLQQMSRSPTMAFPGAGLLATLERMVVEEMSTGAPLARRQHDDIFFLQYTSGSTSQPKGVMVAHDNVLHNCKLVVDHEAPVAVSWLPQHHDMGLIGYYIFIALSGGTTYGFSTTDFIRRPALWLSTISNRHATASSAPNFAYEYCLQPGRLSDQVLATLDLGSLRFLMAAAEPVHPDIYRRFLHKFQKHGLRPESFFVAYGLAENTLAVTNYGRTTISVHKGHLANGSVRLTEGTSAVVSARHLMSCGVPLEKDALRIVDPERNLALDEGEVGEIWVTGASKCRGYWANPSVTKSTFEARLAGEPPEAPSYLRTGDLGFLHSGEVYVCGRLKDMIIIRGQNIFPQDIEAAVEECSSSVRSGCVAAFSLDDASMPSIAVVAEVKAANTLPNGAMIVRRVGERLGIDIRQIAYVPPKAIPRTTSGKIMRFRARQMFLDRSFKVLGSFERSRDADQMSLGAATSGPFDTLYSRYGLRGDERITLREAGVDSLDLVVLMHELKELLGKSDGHFLGEHVDLRFVQEITVADLFRLKNVLSDAPDSPIIDMQEMLVRAQASREMTEQKMIQTDALSSFRANIRPLVTPPTSILLTGGTGFMGPFLLSSLLEQTDALVYVLVRAATSQEARARLLNGLLASGSNSAIIEAFHRRVVPVRGDLEKPSFDLTPKLWRTLRNEVGVIFHNAALVNYLLPYALMRGANVNGTRQLLQFALEGRGKEFNYISTTFIFGWATKPRLFEVDNNDEMDLLDFGYSQSKWVSEQLVISARRAGLPTRIFRPALVTPSVTGAGGSFDITIRLLTFMIKHGIGVNASNQVSFMPVDVTANNIVAISQLADTLNKTFHVTRDNYTNMIDVTDILSVKTGCRFNIYALRSFVPEVIRRCTRDDLLFPLLDFFVGSIDSISSMEFKRYDNLSYRLARDASPAGMPDPSLDQTVDGILAFIDRNRLL
jgi:thioester reductase-like protein